MPKPRRLKHEQYTYSTLGRRRRLLAHFSTAEQTLGPEAQRATLEAWATRAGVPIAAWHDDHGVSGGNNASERPGLTRALRALHDHRAGVLIVAKPDRLARDVGIALEIERAIGKQGARIVSADGTAKGTEPGDEFMRVVIDGAAQYERALIRARTRASRRASGEAGAGLPGRVCAFWVQRRDRRVGCASATRSRSHRRCRRASCTRPVSPAYRVGLLRTAADLESGYGVPDYAGCAHRDAAAARGGVVRPGCRGAV